MNDVTVVTSVTYSSPESLALVADVQYHEPYLSAALNRKFRGIVDPGFYAGFLPKPGGGMNLLITSVDGDKTAGAASVDIGEFYQVTIQHRKDISLALNAGKKYAIVLKGRYLLGEDTYQVNTASHIHAAEFVARTYTDSYQLGDGELLVCTVNIPAGVSTITQEMIDTSERINRTIGIDISDSVTSTRSDVAASSLAVKKAYDLAKSKYTAQDASTTQKGLVQLSSATNSESETEAATPKAVKALHDMLTSKYTGQDATTGRKGIVQLSSATNSNSETLAATPKAVSDALSMAFVKPTTSLGETDLNTLGRKEDAGDYYQQSDSGARTDRNYPVEKAGELRIRVGAWGFCQHEYTSWDPPRKFIRTVTGNFNGNGPWSEWVEVTNTDATTGRKGIVQL
ncbi:TPA: pyocin knob domain-containing protein, partial [Escherichia coli]